MGDCTARYRRSLTGSSRTMRTSALAWMCVLLLPLCGAPPFAIEGDWEGTLKTPGGELPLVLHITATPDGRYAAKADSPAQAARGIPVTEITFQDGTLRWSIQSLNASYAGKTNADHSAIEGTFTQGMDLPLVLRRAQPPHRTQQPKPPFPYTAEDSVFPSKAADVKLAGTLLLPSGKGPHPAVILITGSGPQNRDEELEGHKPFLVLADFLVRRGIAVLRYDDRGVAQSTGNFATATTADFADDAEGAFLWLAARKEIDPKRIGLAGHSEGGVVAPMVAARNPKVAFLVLMAGTAVPGEQVLYAQGEALLKAAGANEEVMRRQREIQQQNFKIVLQNSDPSVAAAELRKVLGGGSNELVEREIRRVTSPWFRFFLTYDPATALEKVKCPVLALNGSRDRQVVASQNLPVIEAALKKAGNRDFRTVELEGLNHLFQPAHTGGVEEYRRIEETIAPVALNTMADWIRSHTGLTQKGSSAR